MTSILRLSILLAVGLISGSALAADLLIDNVNGYTLDSAGELRRFEAMLVDKGKVVATGTRAAMKGRASDASVVDGKSRTLLPGLYDAHGHVMGLGMNSLQADLVGTQSLDAALAKVKSFAESHPDPNWIFGRGWNQVIWKLDRFPTAKELDSVIPDRPALLSRVDGHAAWANSAAIKLAGVNKDTKDPVGGRIERDADGNPSGVFVDEAIGLIASKVPKMPDSVRSAALTSSLEQMASLGLTSVADAGMDVAEFELYKRFADEGMLTTRIYAMIAGTGEDFDTISTGGPLIGYGQDFLTVRSVKLYSDGALGSRGAAMLAPYSDDPKNSGLLMHTPQELTAMIGKAIGKDYQVAVHAIGDAANREVLDSLASTYAKEGGKALRNRIEHAQVVSLEDIPRFATLDLIASMQPTHATSDMNMAEDRVGAERIKGAYAWQRLLEQGTRVAAGSDFPVESANPFYGLHAAVTRQDHQNRPAGGWHKDQALSVVEAFRAFTLDAAYAGHQEASVGTLEPGHWADFILVDQDIFEIDPKAIWSTRVLETWVAGKNVYTMDPK